MASVPPPLVPTAPGPPPLPPELPAGAGAVQPRWPAWTAPIALLAALSATVLGQLLVALVAIPFGYELVKPPPGVLIASVVVQDAAFVGAALGFAAVTVRPAAWHFGLRTISSRRWIGLAVGTWIAFLVILLAWSAIFGPQEQQDLPDRLGIDSSVAALVAVTLLITVLAPIAEELFFRGFFFNALRSWAGPWVAAALTGVAFGAVHASSAPVLMLVPLALFGFALCLLLWRSGSLLPCMAAHSLNNALALGVIEGWRWWVVIAVMLAANGLIAAVAIPVARRAPRLIRPAT